METSMTRLALSLLLVASALGCQDDPISTADGDAGDSGSSSADAGRGDTQGTDSGLATCELTEWEQMMLDDHNEWRALVNPPAANMHRVYWDRNIAQNAADWVASCDPDWPHSSEDDRSDIGGYEILGENLSYCAGTGCSDNAEVTDGSGSGDGVGWWDERTDYDWESDESTGITSHYTLMVSSNVYAIGCATQRCTAPGPGGWDGEWWWTICQYGPRGQAYWSGTKPYDSGDGVLVEPSNETLASHPGICR